MGRKPKKLNTKPVNTCVHDQGFDFHRTGQGVKRVCRNGCGHSVTDVAMGISGVPIKPGLRHDHLKRKKMRHANG